MSNVARMVATASQMLESANLRPGHILTNERVQSMNQRQHMENDAEDAPTAVAKDDVSRVEPFGLAGGEVGEAFGTELVGVGSVERGVTCHVPV